MKLKLTAFFIMLTMIFSASALSASAELSVSATTSSVYVNSTLTDFDAYNINGNNYFKLRDIAYYLNGSERQFSVNWNAINNSILLSTNSPYTPVGGEGEIK